MSYQVSDSIYFLSHSISTVPPRFGPMSCTLRKHKSNLKPKTPFMAKQLADLEEIFLEEQLPVTEWAKFSASFKLTEIQVKIWFKKTAGSRRSMWPAENRTLSLLQPFP